MTVGGEDLTALVQPGGDWNITPSALDDGAHTVVATVRDPAENAGTDSQELELELDTTAPALTISGGDGALSDDATPEISGTADVALGTNVTVTIGNQTMTTLVQADGGWNATPAPVGVGT